MKTQIKTLTVMTKIQETNKRLIQRGDEGEICGKNGSIEGCIIFSGYPSDDIGVIIPTESSTGEYC